MKKCNACGTMNPNENLFCENCAASIKDVAIVESKKAFPVNKKYIKIIGAVAAFILVVFVGSQILFASSPGAQILSGLVKSSMADKNEGHMELSFESEDSTMDDLLKDMRVVFDYEVDKNNASTKAEFFIKDESALEGIFALQDSVIYVDLLDLYDEKFYYTDDTIELYAAQTEQFRGYLKNVSLKGVDVKKYVKIIESELGKDLYKKGGRVHLELNEDNVLDLMEVVFEEAEGDEKLAKAIHKDLIKVLNEMIDDDFEYYGMDGDDWEMALEEIEDFGDFEDNFEQAISDMLDSIEWEKESDYSTAFELKISFDFGFLNTIKAMDVQFEVDDLLSVNASYQNNSKHGFKKFKSEEGVDIEDLMDDYDEMTEVSQTVLENFSDKIQNNKTLVKYIESSDYYKEMASWYGFESVEELFEILLSEYLY